MGKVKQLLESRSLKTAFARAIAGCIFSALLPSLLLSGCCQWGQACLYEKYGTEYKYVIDETGIMPGHEKVQFEIAFDGMKASGSLEMVLYDGLGFFRLAVYPICFILSILLTSALFYRRYLQKPFAILAHAAGEIAQNNLDFRVVYDREDELGQLCASFEKMRLALRENEEELWRQMEERRRLNAAFSHDLRTPLTVLKGQSELLMRYAPKMSENKVIETAERMNRHIGRLETYVKKMGALQRLEDMEIHRISISLGSLWQQLAETGEVLCSEKKFVCPACDGEETALCVDTAVVWEVYENLLSNAVRFARERITAAVRVREGDLYLTVADDGDGFTNEDLRDAVKPFYKTVRETNEEHFGLGLNICKILCEKHGGFVRLENDGGAVVVAVFGLG
ncbi:MAG: HAMP domain-containing histidine kinase [Lachnospiraceae bacterium]|nr:HAMP domain-containing histidine kinase [Lachnospiraceae bacterium]